MVQTSFAERLQRIEKAQARPVHERVLAGISEEIDKPANAKASKAAKTAGGRAGSSAGKPMRFCAGFLLMFASFLLVRRMADIHLLLDGSEMLAPFTTTIMAAIAVSVIFVLLFFAFKLQRAAFRVLSEPVRIPFALGMVIGLAAGLGPTELADTMMAQLH